MASSYFTIYSLWLFVTSHYLRKCVNQLQRSLISGLTSRQMLSPSTSNAIKY